MEALCRRFNTDLCLHAVHAVRGVPVLDPAPLPPDYCHLLRGAQAGFVSPVHAKRARGRCSSRERCTAIRFRASPLFCKRVAGGLTPASKVSSGVLLT